MADSEQDKRSTRRFPLRLPVDVTGGNVEAAHAETRDVSARGICFYIDQGLTKGSAIDFTLTLPPEVTLTESIKVRCRGKVVRTQDSAPAGKVAVAAVIDEYEFLAES